MCVFILKRNCARKLTDDNALLATSFRRCLPSKLLRAELLRRNFLWRDDAVVAFVEDSLNGCCNDNDALKQVQKWKLQKLGADARARERQRERVEAESGRVQGGSRQVKKTIQTCSDQFFKYRSASFLFVSYVYLRFGL
jgi:hypothetical protein